MTDPCSGDLTLRQRAERMASGIGVSVQEQRELGRWALARLPVGDDDLRRLEQLARAATPGRRRFEPSWNNAGIPLADLHIPGHTLAVEMMLEDAAFIAACDRATILGLIARVHAAEGRLGANHRETLRQLLADEQDDLVHIEHAVAAGRRVQFTLDKVRARIAALTAVLGETPDARPPHAFAGDGHDCTTCGEGRQFYLHTDREEEPPR